MGYGYGYMECGKDIIFILMRHLSIHLLPNIQKKEQIQTHCTHADIGNHIGSELKLGFVSDKTRT